MKHSRSDGEKPLCQVATYPLNFKLYHREIGKSESILLLVKPHIELRSSF